MIFSSREEERSKREADLRGEMEVRERLHREMVERLQTKVRGGFSLYRGCRFSVVTAVHRLSQIALLEKGESKGGNHSAAQSLTGNYQTLASCPRPFDCS